VKGRGILCAVALAATASARSRGDDSWAPRAADPVHAAERCDAWAVAATGVDPRVEAERPYVTPLHEVPESASERSLRFSRGYEACLASEGLLYR
jgi:hypothetical protein